MNRRTFIQCSFAGTAAAAWPELLGAADHRAIGIHANPPPHRTGRVRFDDHAVVDDQGAFLGLGVTYFKALWRYRYDRARLESDLAFLWQQGFRYSRVLSMVGWSPAWKGIEIAPVNFPNRAGHAVAVWPDYWQALAGLVDLSDDRFGLRTPITIFADAQLLPRKADRIEHLRRLLAEVYRDSAADIATWHFSRDRAADDGWRPVIDCRRLANVPGCPPVSSNEPIGPGASVASETDPSKLVLAAAYAFASRLPMYVFHSEAGVFGRTRFEDTPAIREFRHLARLLPGDLANWTSVEAGEPDAPLSADGCVSLVCCQRGERIVCVPVGVRRDVLALTARAPLRLRALDLLTGEELGVAEMVAGKRTVLNLKSAAVVLMN